MLEAKDLSVNFGKGRASFQAVKEANFTLYAGESLGLVGESGSGKSTILRAIAGLVNSWSGEIELQGRGLIGRNRSMVFRKQVQMVFQDPYGSLHPRHTVDQILGESVRVHKLGDADKRVLRLLDEVGLSANFRFRYPHQLSGGQRQRVAIARALIVEPELILLDEPTSALDVSVQAEVLNLLTHIKRDRGLSYLLVSHDLAVISHMCDRLLVMQHGAIVETLTVQQLRDKAPTQAYTRELLNASV